ncbi:hypothetical protein [Amycolatopsis thermoflava]|uniref:hypothetical protein n=1 Tax=Amycolatopsis thermoflava TaxID=84480 RepID=UPI003EB9F2CF
MDVLGDGVTGTGEGGEVAADGEVVDGADVGGGAAGFSPQAFTARTTAATNPATRAFMPVHRVCRVRRCVGNRRNSKTRGISRCELNGHDMASIQVI